MSSMSIGISPYAENRAGVLRVADAAVAAGIETFWLGDGLLEVDMFPMWCGGIEPFVELSYLAGRYPGVRVALGAAVVPLRDVQWLAKQAATLDQFTEGRFLLGLAPGFWEREFDYRGLPFKGRGRLFEEGVAALRAAFAGEPFTGDHVTLPAGPVLSPRPFTPGGPPIWYAGGPATFERALRDGVPFQARRTTPDEVAELARVWRERGGTDLAVRVPFEVADAVATGDDAVNRVAGPPSYLAEQLATYAELGIADVSVIPGRDEASSLRTIEALATEVLPAVLPRR